ncbi:Pr6Pr family membrane protein [Cellulomonas sp. C5510]|uniref:Pr6Pr family membrane protein n=1 Tax=Cellulomonas sp. C5510 TaxID=2871170 RepID=UPI001C940F28|nr:Pr6Pr family membrane protein [Cellulomonas sp. C5510]QZN86718.1 Pr6Pr family membrane protein [Cellulomonas sp. C5510]
MTTPAVGATPPGRGVAPARVLHAVPALAAGGGLVLEVGRALAEGPGDAGTTTERLVRLFSYFTIQSNLLVLAASVLLVARPARTDRFPAVLHLDALLCVAVTGVVYHGVLADPSAASTPSGRAADLLLHTVAPVATWLVWLLVGPRPRFGGGTAAWAVVYPLVWIAWTFTRGAATGWYPYPFLDVAAVGAARAALNTAAVAAGFLVLALLVRLLERVLPRTPRVPTAPAAPPDAPDTPDTPSA